MNKTKNIVGIYCITNTVNGKRYIGHSNNIKKRWGVHRSTLKHNKHGNKELQADYNKQNESDFVYSVLKECLQRDLTVFEKKYKDLYGDNVYNTNNIITNHKKIRRGKEAKIFREKWSLQNRGSNNPHNTKFTEPDIISIKSLIADGANLVDIAEKFGTTEGYIRNIKNGSKWKHVS